MPGEKSWIVHGPQGIGKGLHARAIADALGLAYIEDDWDGRPETFHQWNTLHLAQQVPAWAAEQRRVLPFDAAMRRVKR